ncbi:hypothetical protein TNCV_1919431 [Trichonephila clavipes]|nr:hypothetical protein TNCV_1919431 [Trichonephila clavipes]
MSLKTVRVEWLKHVKYAMAENPHDRLFLNPIHAHIFYGSSDGGHLQQNGTTLSAMTYHSCNTTLVGLECGDTVERS